MPETRPKPHYANSVFRDQQKKWNPVNTVVGPRVFGLTAETRPVSITAKPLNFAYFGLCRNIRRVSEKSKLKGVLIDTARYQYSDN